MPLRLLVKLLLPMALWCFLYKGFLWGSLYISEDTFAVYAVVKYFLSQLVSGTFAHWNPYLNWGMGHICQIGEFNPIWSLVLMLNATGLDVYHAFLWTLVVYVFVSSLGVYCLLRRLFKEEFLAYFGFLAFLFSGAGMTVFTQITIILIFAPAIWFFYFLTDFYQSRSRSSVLFLCFTLMLIVTTYIPFYFITTAICLFLLSIFLYPNVIKGLFERIVSFIRSNPFITFFGLAAVLVAVMVSLLNWLALRSDFLVMARPAVLDYASAKDAGIPIGEILRGPSLFSFLVQSLFIPLLSYSKEIFSFAKIPFDDQRIFYIPLMAHLVILVAFFTRLNKRSVLWGVACFGLFLIALANLTPVYEFLFVHVPFFRMFRNIFLLTPFISALYILLACEQFRLIWFDSPVKDLRLAAWSVVSFGLFFVFWQQPQYSLISSQLVLVVFGLLLILRFVGVIASKNRWVLALLASLVLIQPAQVLFLHAAQFKGMEPSSSIIDAAREPIGHPQFQFTRPSLSSNNYSSINPNNIYRLYNWHIIAMKDAPGFFTLRYGYPTERSFGLFKESGSIPGFDRYIAHKFVVYDRFNTSVSFSSAKEFAAYFPNQEQGRLINAPGQGIEVSSFNGSQIFFKTNFKSQKFIVYNDSYHPRWKARINGKPVQLFLANYAFKGIWVPAGEQSVRLDFESSGGAGMYRAVMIFFYAFFFYCLAVFIRQDKRGSNNA